MRALVTGSSGFVGRHIAARLVADGYEVLGMDAEPSPPYGTWAIMQRDARRLPQMRFGHPFDLVVHCAAIVGGRAKIEGDPLAIAQNLELDAAMFRWAAVAQPGRVVYFSSSAAYPVTLQDRPRLLRETMIETKLNIGTPDQTYGLAKIVGEMLAPLAREAGVPVTVIRPFSGYGTDQALDYPFPTYIERARRREHPFDVWGDGEQTRDFIHIDDIVELTMRCVEQGIDGPINACTGQVTSFNQLAVLVAGMSGYAPEIRHLPAAPVGVQHRVGDPTLMNTIRPATISLVAGIERALGGTT